MSVSATCDVLCVGFLCVGFLGALSALLCVVECVGYFEPVAGGVGVLVVEGIHYLQRA